MNKTSIQWTDYSWNPLLGCRRVSRGCGDHTGGGCYAERLIAVRMSKNSKLPLYHDLARLTPKGQPQFTGVRKLVPDRLDEPLRARKGRKIFVCDMGDLFYEGHPFEDIAAVWGVMAAAHWQTFQVLTKRPERALEFLTWLAKRATDGLRLFPYDSEQWRMRQLFVGTLSKLGVEMPRNVSPHDGPDPAWPLPNVHIGVSVEDQAAADRRIPLLLRIPAALRFLSCEPLLEAVDLTPWMPAGHCAWECAGCKRMFSGRWQERCPHCQKEGYWCGSHGGNGRPNGQPIGWVISGGESGPGARPFDLAWARSLLDQCHAAGVPYFVKQLGARPVQNVAQHAQHGPLGVLQDKHGGIMDEWPLDLRVREFPRVEVHHAAT